MALLGSEILTDIPPVHVRKIMKRMQHMDVEIVPTGILLTKDHFIQLLIQTYSHPEKWIYTVQMSSLCRDSLYGGFR